MITLIKSPQAMHTDTDTHTQLHTLNTLTSLMSNSMKTIRLRGLWLQIMTKKLYIDDFLN